MDIQTMKLAFMEEFLKLKDKSVIKKLTRTLHQETQKTKSPSISNFAGILDDQDAKAFLEASDECRKIDTNEW